MKILKKQVLRGPNIWSNYRTRLIQVRLDLDEMENFPTDTIEGFGNRLKALLPSLVAHTCSIGTRGGFFERVDRGTWLGHVMEHIALEIQTLAGMDTGYGRTRGTLQRGVYNMVFSYEVEQAGLYAADAAFEIISALCVAEPVDLEKHLEELRRLRRHYGLGPSTRSMVEEAEKRNIPWMRLNSGSSIQFGHGAGQKRIQATMTCQTSATAMETACDKEDTKDVLANARIPVAAGGVCSDRASLLELIAGIGYPIVIKPLDGNQGKGATINVSDQSAALQALEDAQKYGQSALVERYVAGNDYRILVIDHRFVAASRRIPAHVTGNGSQSIRELVEKENSDPRRGRGHENELTKITFDKDTFSILERMGRNLESIPEDGETVYLKSTANLSTGGTAVDATEEVGLENRFMAERISRVIGLDICGIDIVSPSIAEPIGAVGGAVLEVNAAPGFRMHLHPAEGMPRNVAAPVLEMLFPEHARCEIPIVAVTGTNGKTTTSRILAHIAATEGKCTGLTTTDGIYIGGFKIEEGDTTGPLSAKTVLSDPMVEFAVLETARGGILRAGLAFKNCDIGIITNIREDHLGLGDIETLSDMANVKGVVARSVKKEGFAVLNADDPECARLARELDCNVAYFSLGGASELFQDHLKSGLPAAYFRDGMLAIHAGGREFSMDVSEIPLAIGGKCSFMIANILAAALGASLSGISEEATVRGLKTFYPSFDDTPGRMNEFKFKDFSVLVDYAHNPHGYGAIEEYLSKVRCTRKVGIISGVGDRRDEDIRMCGAIAARMFDRMIIKQEKDLRGRTAVEINNLLTAGMLEERPDCSFEIMGAECDAVRQAILQAREGDFIVALSDQYRDVVAVVQSELEKERAALEAGQRVA